MTRPTYAQLECLVEFLEQNNGIARGLLRTTQAKVEVKRKWAAVANTLNALGGAVKDGPGWAKYWAEKKCALKKQCATLSASRNQTGGGTPNNLPTLSSLDSRLVAVMGGQEFALRDVNLTVNPFPESSQMQSNNESVTEETVIILPLNEISSPTISGEEPETPTPTVPTVSQNRRRRRSEPRSSNSGMERFTSIEEKRVEAEAMTAQALSQMASTFANIAEEFKNMTNAITLAANALSAIADKMQTNNYQK